jgi:parvulin-like peptidyl-prolyl isomerase
MQRRLASSLIILAVTPALQAEVLNRIVLRVNDQIATLLDYRERKEDFVREIMRRETDPQERTRQIAEAGEMVFADLFRDLLLQSRADQLGVEITEAQLDESVAQLRQNFGIKTDEEFAAALAQSGVTLEQFRAQMKSNLRIQEVRGREVQGKAKVDEDDLRRYYRKNQEEFRLPEQIQVREVVVLEEGGGSAEERHKVAEEIRRQVAAGKSLADAVAAAAKPGATSNVIDHGWVSQGDLDKSLETAAWKLDIGKVSEPVAGRGGLHLLQVAERRESRIPPFADVAAKIRAREQDRVFREEVGKFMVELEKKALIVANPPQEAANYRQQLARRGVEEATDLAGADPSAPEPVVAPEPAEKTPRDPIPPPPPAESKPPHV